MNRGTDSCFTYLIIISYPFFMCFSMTCSSPLRFVKRKANDRASLLYNINALAMSIQIMMRVCIFFPIAFLR